MGDSGPPSEGRTGSISGKGAAGGGRGRKVRQISLFPSLISVKFSIVSGRSREKGRPRIPWKKFVVCP